MKIDRFSFLVLLLPMVKEPKCSIRPQWRGHLTTSFISGGKKSKFLSTWACTLCFVAQVSLKSLPMSWVSRRLPWALLLVVSTASKALGDRLYTHHISEVLTAGWWLSFIYIFKRIRWKSGAYMFMTGSILCVFVYLCIIFHIVSHFRLLMWFSLGHTSI